jgi:hypothetical protein
MAITFRRKADNLLYHAEQKGTIADGVRAGIGKGRRTIFEIGEEPLVKDNVEFKVRCSGKMHRILVTPRGHFVLLDHKDPIKNKAFMVQASFGGPKVKCVALLENWKGGGYAHHSVAHIQQYFRRKKWAFQKGEDSFASGNSLSRTRDATIGELEMTVANSNWEGSYELETGISDPARITYASISNVQKFDREWRTVPHIKFGLSVPLKWSRQEPKSIAGHVVTKVIEEREDGFKLQLLRVIKTKRGPIPVLQVATVYLQPAKKKARFAKPKYSLVWNAWEKKVLPDKITFSNDVSYSR